MPIALLRARETVMGPIRDILATSGVNEQKWRVLRVLEERGRSELTVLAQEACLLLPSLTRIIRTMEEDALITRITPLDDRRKAVVAVTDKARALLTTHLAASNLIFTNLEAQFGREKLATLLDLLEELQAVSLPPIKSRAED